MKKTLSTLILTVAVSVSWGLEVLEATCDKSDVKDALASIRRNENFYYGKLELKDAGDGKMITVRLKDAVDHTEKTFQFKADEELVLMDGMKLSEKFFICGVWYGGGKNFVNVNGSMKYLCRKKRAFDVTPRYLNARKDPAPGVKKELILLVSKDNQFKTLKYPEGTRQLWTNEIDEALGKGSVPIAEAPASPGNSEK